MKPFAVAGLIAAVAVGPAAYANEAAITARQSQFKLFQHHLATLGGMARGTIDYDAELAASAAANLSNVAQQDQRTFWPEGSDAASAEGTRALPVIWENLDDFAGKFADLRTATEVMQGAAGTDLASLQGAMGQLTGACGSCHQTYRAPE